MTELIGYFDGCCEPMNPGGTMGFSGILKDKAGNVLFKKAGIRKPEEWTGKTSNNIAEYLGLEILVDYCLDYHKNDNLLFAGDSQLVVNQCLGKWQIKQGLYCSIARIVCGLFQRLPNAKIQWISRDHNVEADELSKYILRESGIKISEWRK